MPLGNSWFIRKGRSTNNHHRAIKSEVELCLKTGVGRQGTTALIPERTVTDSAVLGKRM